MNFFINILINILLCLSNNKTDTYEIKFEGNIISDAKCKLLVLNKRTGIEDKGLAVKSFLLCIHNKSDSLGKEIKCSPYAGNVIIDGYKDLNLMAMPHGKYEIIIKDIICGPAKLINTDIKHFRIKDFQFNIQI